MLGPLDFRTASPSFRSLVARLVGFVSLAFVLVAGCGGSPLVGHANDGGTTDAAEDRPDTYAGDAGVAGDAGDAGDDERPDANVCNDIADQYAAAVLVAQECNLGDLVSCAIQVRASFWCDCVTYVNGGVDTLNALVAQFQSAGCKSGCTGICLQTAPLTCLADATSPTGGRCGRSNLLALASDDDGGAVSVTVGEEIDITLAAPAPGTYGQDPVLSSAAVTVLEVNIPAGPPTPNGATKLYRLRAVASGQVEVQIPFDAPDGGTTTAPYTLTINVI
jgi:hypothetical protein